MSYPSWIYPLTLYGNLPHEVRVTLKEEGLLWELYPLIEDEDTKTSSCLQDTQDFNQYGPPEAQEFIKAPATVLDAVCAATQTSNAAWREPLHPMLLEWLTAAEKGDIEHLHTLLVSGQDIDTCDHHDRSALWYAYECHQTSTWLLENGANPNLQDRYGHTVLMNAARRNDELRANLYRLHGADLKLRSKSGKTAWLEAIESKSDGTFTSSLTAHRDDDWPKALHIAAWCSHATWMKGQTWYVEAQHPEMNLRRGRFEDTPLQACLLSYGHHHAAVRWLTENGADLTVLDKRDGSTVLHHVAKRNFPWLVAACVLSGVDVNALNADGQTALALALDQNECPRLIKTLLQQDADPSITSPYKGRHAEAQSITAVAKAKVVGLVWSHWMLSNKEAALEWSGLCAYAMVPPIQAEQKDDESDPPDGAAWLEFPAEWCAKGANEVITRLQQVISTTGEFSGKAATFYGKPSLLNQSEALKQPWAWPGRKLWAIFPDGTLSLVTRFSDERPREIISDPAAFQPSLHHKLKKEWNWRARDWKANDDHFSTKLSRGTLTWRAYNTQVEQSISRFRIEGPPEGSDFHILTPLKTLDELCALIGDSERLWELPCGKASRKERVDAWSASQPPPLPFTPVAPPPHQSGLWCYALLEIEDHFTTAMGAGGDGSWACWIEFPAEWCYPDENYLEFWLTEPLKYAYRTMSAQASASTDGGHYTLKKCLVTVLSRKEAVKQPWTARGKVLYQTDERPTSIKAIPDEEKHRPIRDMADPQAPPQPIPISPPPLPDRHF